MNNIQTIMKMFEDIGTVSFVIRYRTDDGTGSTRTITPIAPLYYSGQWGVFAWCHDRKAPRWFRMDRVGNLDPLPLARTFEAKEIARMVANATVTLRRAITQAVKQIDDYHARMTLAEARRQAQLEKERAKAELAEMGLPAHEGDPGRFQFTAEELKKAWKAREITRASESAIAKAYRKLRIMGEF